MFGAVETLKTTEVHSSPLITLLTNNWQMAFWRRLEFQTSPPSVSSALPTCEGKQRSRPSSSSHSADFTDSSSGGSTSLHFLKHVQVARHFVTLFRIVLYLIRTTFLTSYFCKWSAFVCFPWNTQCCIMQAQAKLNCTVSKVTFISFFAVQFFKAVLLN